MRPLTLLVVLIALAVPAAALAEDAPNPAVAACKTELAQLGQAGFATKYGAGEAGGRACIVAHGGTSSAATPPPPANPREVACKGEYQSLGATAFAAKYGPGADGLRACINGKTAAPKPEPGTSVATIAAQLCELEYKRNGADAFVAKYGDGDAGKRACVQAKTSQAQTIAETCRKTAEPAACAKAALGDVVSDGAKAGPLKDKPRAQPKAVVVNGLGAGSVAEAMCKSLGSGKSGLGACVKAMLPKAKLFLATCKPSSAGNKDLLRQCLTAALTSIRRR